MRFSRQLWFNCIAAAVWLVPTGSAQVSPSGNEHSAAMRPRPRIAGYFTQWGIYGKQYFVKNIDTSGSAEKLSHILYAFGNVTNGQCALVDPWADYQKPFDAETSVDGVADDSDVPGVYGNFGQLLKLKAKYPHLKILISLGGYTLSGGFSSAAATPASREALVTSCIDMFIKGKIAPGFSAPGLFDGIDIDWEYPAACGLTCGVPEDTVNFTLLLQQFRTQLEKLGGQDRRYLLTAATPAGAHFFSKIQLEKVAHILDFVNVMTYDYHGTWESATNHLAPLRGNRDDPGYSQKLFIDATISDYLAAGVPPRKINLGIPFYGSGWAGVPNVNHGLFQPATGPAPGTFGPGSDDYKVLKDLPGFKRYFDHESRAFWIYNADKEIFWTFDNPISVTAKMLYIREKAHGLGGAMFWELSGDDDRGSLITTIYRGLAPGLGKLH